MLFKILSYAALIPFLSLCHIAFCFSLFIIGVFNDAPDPSGTVNKFCTLAFISSFIFFFSAPLFSIMYYFFLYKKNIFFLKWFFFLFIAIPLILFICFFNYFCNPDSIQKLFSLPLFFGLLTFQFIISLPVSAYTYFFIQMFLKING